MKIRISNGIAMGYFEYSYSNICNSPVSIYDVMNIFYSGYGLDTYLYYDMERDRYCICSIGSITTMISLRTTLRYLYDLIDLSES